MGKQGEIPPEPERSTAPRHVVRKMQDLLERCKNCLRDAIHPPRDVCKTSSERCRTCPRGARPARAGLPEAEKETGYFCCGRATHLCPLFAGFLDDEVLAAQISELGEEQQQQAGENTRHGAAREAARVPVSVNGGGALSHK